MHKKKLDKSNLDNWISNTYSDNGYYQSMFMVLKNNFNSFDAETNIRSRRYKKGKVNTMNNNLTNVTVNSITSDDMLVNVLNRDELKKARETKETESVKTENGTTIVLNPVLRDYYKDAYKKLETVGENVLLAKRKMIVAVMNSDDFKQSFVNDADFAESIGETKTFVSKAKSCIATLNWLSENGFTDEWTSSQLDEITPTLNKSLKTDKAESLKTMLKVLFEHGVFNTALSARKVRELFSDVTKEYNKIVPPMPDNKADDNKADDNKADDNETDDNKVDDNKADDNKADDNKADDNKADDNKADDNKADDNKADDNKADDNKSDDNKADDKQQLPYDDTKYGIAQLTITAKLNCGMSVSIEGNCKKGKPGDKTYKAIRKAIEDNPELMAMLRDVLQSVTN